MGPISVLLPTYLVFVLFYHFFIFFSLVSIMATRLAHVIRRAHWRSLAAATAGGIGTMALAKTLPTSPFAHNTPSLTNRHTHILTTAQCMCRAPPPVSAALSEDKMGKLEQFYEFGHLTDIYELLNNDPETSTDPILLFHLARATFKLGLARPLPGAKVKADVHALYAIVLQNRGSKKGGPEKRKFYEAAQQHLTAALKEDRENFLANYAFAEMNRDVAEQFSQEVVPQSGPRFSLFRSEDSAPKKDVETWKAVNRYAQKAVFADPNDVQSLNLLAKAKYELGDIAEAKKLTVRAINTSRSPRFADERKAIKETRELMEKINDHFGNRKN